METYGTIYKQLPIVEGEKDGKAWRRGGVVLKIDSEKNVRYLALETWGDDVDKVADIPEKTLVRASYSIESTEFGEKWYTKATLRSIQTFTATC